MGSLTRPRTYKRVIDTSDADKEQVKAYHDAVAMLAGLVIECTETNPACLLSPLHREVLINHAKGVKKINDRIGLYLCVDNLTQINFMTGGELPGN